MAPRANWKGYLKLSLVSCAVALYPATTTSVRTRFNIINRNTGHRIHNEIVDAETGEPVAEEDRVKGYKEGSRYILLEEEELDRVALESTHTIDIDSFVDRDEVDPLYFDSTYFVAPTDEVGAEAFAVIREAMRKKNVVGLARVVLYRRERIVMLAPRDEGLVATTLHYASEVRDADVYFDDIPDVKISADMMDLAAHILERKHRHFQPEKFEDRYEQALQKLIRAKRAGKELPEPPQPDRGNVIDLMEALRQSVKAERGGGAQRKAATHRSGRRTTASRRKPGGRKLKKAS